MRLLLRKPSRPRRGFLRSFLASMKQRSRACPRCRMKPRGRRQRRFEWSLPVPSDSRPPGDMAPGWRACVEPSSWRGQPGGNHWLPVPEILRLCCYAGLARFRRERRWASTRLNGQHAPARGVWRHLLPMDSPSTSATYRLGPQKESSGPRSRLLLSTKQVIPVGSRRQRGSTGSGRCPFGRGNTQNHKTCTGERWLFGKEHWGWTIRRPCRYL